MNRRWRSAWLDGRRDRRRQDRRCAMAMDTFIVFAASYDSLGAAEADYHAVG